MLFFEMTTAAQTAFAGLDQAARQAEVMRSVGDLPGGFAKKTVDARVYWYYQWKNAAGKLHQIYVGPDNESTRGLMALQGARTASADALRRQARSALELGCHPIPPKHAKIIGRLIDHGFFRAGGVLVGTHAYIAFQNILGASWAGAAVTLDLDFAHRGTSPGNNISLALDEGIKIDTHSAIESLEMGFLPVASGTTFKKPDEPDLDLDFLTVRGRSGDKPAYLDRLNLNLQPMKFMEFSILDPIRATLIARSGPLVVNIPRPERYAVHKLIVYGERPQAQRTKSNKDLEQAATLFDYLLKHDEEEICASWEDAYQRGPGWRSRLDQGWSAMVARYPNCSFPERMRSVSGILTHEPNGRSSGERLRGT